MEGAHRIEPGTILSYMLVQPGDPFDGDRIDRSLKTLYASGLFSDVQISRDGNGLLVKVVENPIINRVAFEGNHKLTDENLRAVVQLRPRGVFSPALAAADQKQILDAYAKKGRYDAQVTPKIIKLDGNRVDVVFEIREGDATLNSRIAFIGNHEFSESELRQVISTREERWWRFLSTSDEYDPERIAYDKELLRRFYLKNGYADFSVSNVSAELSPDRQSFFITYTINEGERYRVGKVTVNSTERHLDGADLLGDVEQAEGDWYDGAAVERSVDALTKDVQDRGFPFVDVKPRISRDVKNHTVDLVFDVGDGPRIYVERLDIVGNTRTEDRVIRREMRFQEGDPFNANLARQSQQNLKDLGFFSDVKISPSAGSTADKAIVTTTVAEKSTGEATLGGGYSTDVGALLNAGLKEHNLLGTGIEAGLNGTIAQKRSSITLSVTDPYFLDRNLVSGFDIFYTDSNYQNVAGYNEKRIGGVLRMGYEFNEHLRQSINYTLVDRNVYDVAQPTLDTSVNPPVYDGGASYYISNEQGWNVLSQFGQTTTIDYRDSKTNPHSGWDIKIGTDAAGAGGDARFVRTKIDGSVFIPFDRFTGNSDWGLAVSAGAGYFFNTGKQEYIIDRFFLGGDNLRGFETGGAGPHDIVSGDALGGREIWTQSTELHFPLPISQDFGLTGRAFVDVGGLTKGNFESHVCTGSNVSPQQTIVPGGNTCPTIFASGAPRVGIGAGVSWDTPFGLINLDLTPFVIKQKYDQTQIFRFGFGTRF